MHRPRLFSDRRALPCLACAAALVFVMRSFVGGAGPAAEAGAHDDRGAGRVAAGDGAHRTAESFRVDGDWELAARSWSDDGAAAPPSEPEARESGDDAQLARRYRGLEIARERR